MDSVERRVTIALGGDALVTRDFSFCDDPSFLQVIREFRQADVSIVNLESLIHEYKGYPQADSGGIPVAAPPSVAFDLAWAGVRMVKRFAQACGSSGNRFEAQRFRIGPLHLRRGESNSLHFRARFGREDFTRMLQEIKHAATQADYVVVSIHDHRQGGLHRTFARAAIDAGASVVFFHGPHEVRGMEVYRGRPVLYSLGSLFFEPEYLERLPAEHYQKLGLSPLAPREACERLPNWVRQSQSTWEGVLTKLEFGGEDLVRITFIPLDIGVGTAAPARGRPRLANRSLGRSIISKIAEDSRRFGVNVEYSVSQNVGLLELDGGCE